MRKFALALTVLALAGSAHAQQIQQQSAILQAVAPVRDLSYTTPITIAQQRAVERLQASALADDRAYALVESLVTEVGPRLAASEAEARARNWAVAMLRANGFSNVRVEPFTIPYWDALREEARIVSTPGAQPMVAAALGGSPSTPAGGLEAEVVRFPDIAALEAADDSAVAGRIVFIDERMTRTRDGSG